MKRIFILFTISFIVIFSSCNKELETTKTDLIQNMIVNKIWYLDYSIEGNIKQTFLGQSTYFVTYLKNGTTKDSDGLNGTFSIVQNNGKFTLITKTKTPNGNNLSFGNVIESVGEVKMIQSYIPFGKTIKTTLYFTSK
jgi:hypothetical protein